MGGDGRPTLAEECEQLALWSAVATEAKAREADARFRVRERLQEAGADRAPLRVNGSKVGSATLGEPRVAVEDEGAAWGWLSERGLGKAKVAVDVRDDATLAALLEACSALGLAPEVTYGLAPGARRRLAVAGGRVVDPATGELAPGCAAAPGSVRVTGCAPAEVGRALAGGDSPTVAGMLGAS